MNGISKLLSTNGFIQVNKALIKKLGLHEAILIGEFCAEYNYWEERNMLDDGYFYSTRDNIEENTGLSEHYQRKALSNLYELGIITIEKRGLPAKNYYKINFDALLSIIEKSSCQRRRQQDTETVDINNNKQTKITNKNNSSSKEEAHSKQFSFGKKRSNSSTKKATYQDCIQSIYEYTKDEKLRSALIDYLNLRLSMMKEKPMRMVQWFTMLDKLTDEHKKSSPDVTKLDIVRRAIERGYTSFYAITNYSSGSVKNKPWEQGVKSETYTEEEKRELEKIEQEMIEAGEQVWY